MQPMNPYDAPLYVPEAPESQKQTVNLWRIHGRIDRAHYLIFCLRGNLCFAAIAVLVLLIMQNFILASFAYLRDSLPLLWIIGMMLVCQAWLAGRRWQDLGRSSAWGLLSLIPIVNLVLFFVLLLKTGDANENRYGKPVLAPPLWQVVVAGIMWLPMFAFLSLMMVVAIAGIISSI